MFIQCGKFPDNPESFLTIWNSYVHRHRLEDFQTLICAQVFKTNSTNQKENLPSWISWQLITLRIQLSLTIRGITWPISPSSFSSHHHYPIIILIIICFVIMLNSLISIITITICGFTCSVFPHSRPQHSHHVHSHSHPQHHHQVHPLVILQKPSPEISWNFDLFKPNLCMFSVYNIVNWQRASQSPTKMTGLFGIFRGATTWASEGGKAWRTPTGLLVPK